MKKYIIRTGTGDEFNAASKARKDADAIAQRMGYEPFVFEGKRTADRALAGAFRLAVDGIRNWRKLIRSAEAGSTVFVQYPHYPMKSALLACRMIPRAKRKKGLRFIALVHDLDSVRGLHGKAAVFSDRRMLPLFDAVICHNERMKEVLLGLGIPEEKLVTLRVFDYLASGEMVSHDRQDGIAVAGNLSPEKSGYLVRLVSLAEEGDFPLNLYGKGLSGHGLPSTVKAYGAVPPGELPGRLCGAFGLVWDGPSAEACTGKNGDYMRINNPHKLSLYLSAGLPVIVWKQAAVSGFVAEQGVGFAADSLAELDGILSGLSDEEYGRLQENACRIGRQLREGAFLEKALDSAERILAKT